MPLMKKPSKKAFEHNVKAEINSGRPQDQALAIAYDTQRRAKAKKMAKGGELNNTTYTNRPDKGYGAIIFKAKGGEVNNKTVYTDRPDNGYGAIIFKAKGGSVSEAVMHKRRMLAEGGDVTPRYEHEDDIGLADSMVDIDDNAKEIPNQYYPRNEDQVLKENYDEDMMDMSQPLDSNEIGDQAEDDTEDKHDMISQIRSKMRQKRQLK